MSLSKQFVEDHIAKWKSELDKPLYSYRKNWPSRIFHHAPLENAVGIVKGGQLLSRNDPENEHPRDVAALEVVNNRAHAHDFARLYFRPRTPTQWNIEGIRKAADIKYGSAHAPVLIMFVFDALKVLSMTDVKFCDRNMQQGAAEPSDTEDYFSKIPFEKVFHQGNIFGDYSIVSHRCAEVLAKSPLKLSSLQWIYCRSSAERDTFVYLLGPSAAGWLQYIRISDDLQVFNRDYVFVEGVYLTETGLWMKLWPRADRANVAIELQVFDSKGVAAISYSNADFQAVPPPPSTAWIFNRALHRGQYLVRIKLEGQLAYENKMFVGSQLV